MSSRLGASSSSGAQRTFLNSGAMAEENGVLLTAPTSGTSTTTGFVWHKKEKIIKKRKLKDEKTRSSSERKKKNERSRSRDPARPPSPQQGKIYDPEELRRELDVLKQRRLEREQEKLLREEERMQAQREADRAQFGDWQTREDDFQLRQTRKRAELRIREGHPQPLDRLIISLQFLRDTDDSRGLMSRGFDVDPREPSSVFDRGIGNSLTELRRLHREIEVLLYLDYSNSESKQFWQAMLHVCRYKIVNHPDANSEVDVFVAEGEDALGISDDDPTCLTAVPRRAVVAPSVLSKIETTLSTMPQEKLRDLEASVRGKLASREPIDVEYWESMLDAVLVHQSKAFLLLANKRLARLYSELRAAVAASGGRDQVSGRSNDKDSDLGAGGSSGGLQDILDINGSAQASSDSTALATRDENLQEREAGEFAREINLDEDRTVYSWAYKYRPRKPRYSNRVSTGFEWNKYNQTHYDIDNPPPRVVQGYKFNIYYPDLLDPSKAPVYKLIVKPESPDTAIIRFCAGPPYEDIAFEIVNKEWEVSHRKGFRCVFDRGVLQLYFHFRRFYYRK